MIDHTFDATQKDNLLKKIKKAGRPKKECNKIEHKITIKFTEDMINNIKDRFESQNKFDSLSAFIRNMILNNLEQ